MRSAGLSWRIQTTAHRHQCPPAAAPRPQLRRLLRRCAQCKSHSVCDSVWSVSLDGAGAACMRTLAHSRVQIPTDSPPASTPSPSPPLLVLCAPGSAPSASLPPPAIDSVACWSSAPARDAAAEACGTSALSCCAPAGAGGSVPDTPAAPGSPSSESVTIDFLCSC